MKPKSSTALLIIDVINDLEFPGGDRILPWAKRMAQNLLPFRDTAHAAGLPVIYVNDNFGLWQGDFRDVYKHCTRAGVRGRSTSRRLKSKAEHFFILKPRHSAFFSTSLEPLLQSLQVHKLILSGMATNLCVFFTAHDAHMRGYEIIVLSDCCAAESDHDHTVALDQLHRFCGARVCRSDELCLKTAKPDVKSARRSR